MGLDIRLPIGLMFGLLGPVLLVTGVVQETPLNVQTGAAMTVFAATMLGTGLWAQRRQRLMSLPSPTQVR
jgi:hypothetical protein